MKRLVLILPYFGQFPHIFPIFLKSIKSNPLVDLLIFTDNTWDYETVNNITIIREDFEQFRKRFIDKLGKSISLKTPYKLCDFKPTYGYVLQDYIKSYEYWGHCDCDLIFGDLNKTVFPLLDKGYDKIFAVGHLTLYRNIELVNQLFRSNDESQKLFDAVSRSDEIWGYDEDYFGKDNIHDVFLKNGMKVYAEDYSVNPSVTSSKFALKKYSPTNRKFLDIPYRGEQYYWENGHLFQMFEEQGKLYRVEKAYMHFQMRNMKLNLKDLKSDAFKIVPNRFIPIKYKPNTMEEWRRERKFYFTYHRLDMIKRKITKKIKGNEIHVHQHNHSSL